VDLRVVDTHCHLFLMEGDPEAAVQAAAATGVSPLVCVGIDPGSSRRSLELARVLPGVSSTAGLHPHEASRLDAEARAEIERLAGEPEVVAVGETGLDFYRRLSPPEDQEAAFRFHTAVARSSGKPVVVHVRDAWERALRILEEESPPSVVLHCFSGDPALAAEASARGYYLSFAGPLTYPKNEGLRAAAAGLSADRLLVETDSPYLPPQGLRGSPNTPEGVHAVVEELARVRGETLDSTAATLFQNALAAFPGLGGR
jgi:TatD DNase family protein